MVFLSMLVRSMTGESGNPYRATSVQVMDFNKDASDAS
ncbi:hypothetical protein CEV32_3235 [Brucella rhizosphaerae]|uniref:Uncharacterized protein n=1 Tax=Brucella rhizosphaerae TaxID=571254 RepID=A0A256FUM0_9HYPH|nr:hypothetical protein CEV32_3235 [Brucella rhizosphaerae]